MVQRHEITPLKFGWNVYFKDISVAGNWYFSPSPQKLWRISSMFEVQDNLQPRQSEEFVASEAPNQA